jgi:hypothetical protein
LYDRAARHARRVETIDAVERRDLRQRPSRINPWQAAMTVWRSRGPLRETAPASPPVEAGTAREPHRAAEVASS